MNHNKLFSFFLFVLFVSNSFKISAQGCSEHDPCQGVTYTQGRWGASNCNSSSYLTNNFSSVFPNGLSIGCSGRILKITSAAQIAAFLPSGSTPTSLPTGTLTNPGSGYSNVLAGQLVALTLNMYFDQNDPNFSPSAISLNNYTITSGTFSGMRVDNFLALANSIIGGCSSLYTYSQVNTAATKINENYDEGTENDGFLKCGGDCDVNVTASYNAIACRGGNTTVTITASNGQAPYTGTGVFTVSAGTYTFNVMDAYGCPAKKVVTFSQPSSSLIATSSSGSISCYGGVTNVTVSATGGTSPYSGTGTFSKAGGVYSFTVTDTKGCTSVTTKTVTQASQLVLSANAGIISCYGGSTNVTLTASGGTPPYNNCGTFNKSAGVHSFTITDSKGCSAVTTITITQPSQLIASNTSGTISCFGGTTTVNVSATGGTSPYTGTGAFTKTSGVYTFTVSDSKGCTSTTSRTLTQPSALVASSGCGTISCNGGTTTLNISASGGTSPYTGTGSFSVSAGVQTFTVTDAKGCTATTSQTISQPNTISVTALAGNISCFGGSTTVSVSASGGTSPYTGTGNFSRSAGVHSFTITDSKGCTAVKTITITEPSQLTITASSGNINCSGGNTTVTISASGGTAPYTGTGTFTRSAGVHSFTITDSKGCSAVKTLTITQSSPLVASANCNANILCFGGTATVNISASGGTAPYTNTGAHIVTAGPYSFTVTDANACTAVVNGTVTQPSQLTASAGSGTLACGGTTTVNISANGGTLPYSGTGVFTVGAGAYSYTVTDANGCKAVVNGTVAQPIPLTASALCTQNVKCFGGTATVNITVSGGTAPYTNAGSHVVSAGPYSFTVTDANNCTAIVSGTITQPSQLTASAVKGTILCNGGTTTISVSGNGGTLPYSGTGVFTIGAGVYSYTVTDANGCKAVVSGTVTQPAVLSASAACTQNVKCFGGTATLNIVATGGTAPYTNAGQHVVNVGPYSYTITDANGCSTIVSGIVTQPSQLTASSIAGNINTFGGTTTVNVSANGGTLPYSGTGVYTVSAGPYSFTVTDANGCTAVVNGTLTQPSALTATAVAGSVLCNGGTTTVMISAAGGVAPYTGTGIFTSTAGTHTYLVSDANGNTVIATVIISQPSALVITASAGNILCHGGTTTVNVSATGGTAPYAGTGIYTVTAGTFTYNVTDANGCAKTTTVTVTEPTVLSANAIAGTINGFGGSTTVSVSANGGTAPYAGTGIFTVTAGSYTYVVTDANGCSSTTTVMVAQPGQLVATATSGNILCNSAVTTVTVSANGGVAPYSGTGTFTAAAGTHTYLVTDANNNSAIASINISQPNALISSANAGNILCNGGTTTLNISATGGTAPYTGTGIFTVVAGPYSYTITDANNCKSLLSGTISQPAPLTATALCTQNVKCFGGTATLNITASGGTAPYSNTGAHVVSSGTYSYTISDANGCNVIVSGLVTQPAPLTASAVSGTISGFGGTTTVNINANGGTLPYSGIGVFTVGAGPYSFTVTDANGCTAIISGSINQPSQLIVNANAGTILCNGGATTVNISATGGVAPYTGTGTFTATAGTHSYLVTDANDNTAIANIIITQPSALNASISSGAILCHGGTTTVNISASGGTGPYTGTGIISVTAGNYTYTLSDANGCSKTLTISISEPSTLSASAVAGSISGFGGSTTVTVSANGGTAPYSGTGIFTVTAGTYTYVVTDANGCTSAIVITVGQPASLVATATTGNILCNGGTTTVNITATGGVGPYTGTGTFTTTAGTHTYLVTDVNGNTTIATINISQPNALVASATSGNILCNGGTTTVNVSATGGTAPYTGTGIFTVPAGVYTYTVTDANGCHSITTITVTQPASLLANASAGTITVFGGSTTVTVSANGGTAPYSGTGIFTVTAGTYTYIVTDANGCSSIATLTLGQPGQLSTETSEGIIYCYGGTTTVAISVSGGVGPYTGLGTFTVSAGTHTYLVTDANGNTTTATVTITQPSPLVTTITSGNILCNGGTTTVNVSATGGTAPYTGTGIFTVTAGNYTYSISDAGGCQATSGGTISISEPTILTANAVAGTISGFGGSTTVTVTANGGTAPYTGTGIFTVTAGTYTYVVTDANGCSTTITIVVGEPDQLVVTGTPGSILCNGGTTSVNISATGGTAPYTGTGVFTAPAGTHTYLVGDANGNTAIATVNISQPNALVASASAGEILCNGGTTTVNVSATGGTAPYAGTGIIAVTAGTYTYLVTDANGCSSTTSITITEPSSLIANAITGTISGFGGSTTVNVTANGGTAPYTGTGVFTVTAGTYTYVVTDANGCSSTIIITVGEPGQLTASATSGTILCNGGTTNVTVTATGGVAPYTGTGIFTSGAGTYTYLVTDANDNNTIATITIIQPNALVALATSGNILCNGGTTTVNISATGGTAPYTGTGIFTVTAGTYTYNVTDANGCSSTVVISVTEPTSLVANVSAGTISGFGGSTTVTVTANGGTAPYSGTGIFTVTAGTYTYVVTDANGCSSTIIITVGEPGQLTASATSGTILCNGGTTNVTVTATGGVAPYTGTGIFTSGAGTYTYLVTDANDNNTIATITIIQPNALVALATSGNILCNGGTTTVNISATGGTAPYTGTGIFTVTAGTYTYNVTDVNGCSSTVVISVTEPTSLVANASAGTISGFGGSTTVTVTANGGTAPYSGTGIFTVTAGTYTYVVTDANGCSSTVTVTVAEPGQLTASATSGTILCNGGTTTVVVTANGGVAPYTGTGIFTASAGTHTYLVTDANGNTAIATVNISQPNTLVASATAGNILCNGGTTTVNISANGGTAPYTGTGIFTVTAGTYTYNVTDANGCSSTVVISVTEPTSLIANVSAGTISGFGGSTTVTVTANGGTAPYSGTGIFTVTAGTYTYVVTDANGCSSTVTVTVAEPGQLTASATSGTILCSGGTTTVVVTANGGVAPYTGTGTFNASAGTNTYLVTDANGNTAIATVNISQPNTLVASATSGNILCNGGTTTVNVSATGGTAPYTGTGIFTVTAGTYTYNVTDANGCSSTAVISVTEPTSLVANVSAGTISGFGGSTTVTVTANGGTAPYSGTGIFTVTAGTYTYVVTDANGCSKTVTITIGQPASLVASATAGNILCNGGTTTVVVTANGGIAPYTGTGIFTASAGTNTYLVTDANGNTAIATVNISQPNTLVASATSGNILCNGGTTTVNVSATGGTAPYTGTGIFTVTAGTYTYNVTDANGCSSTVVISVTEPASLVANVSAGTISGFGGSTTVTVTANGGTAPYTGTGIFTVTAGTYTYVVTDANGCSSTVTVTVAEPGQLTASATSGTILCNGGTTTVVVTANGGVAPYTGTGIFTASAGTNTYLVTDANGNTTVATINISQPNALIASANAGNILCNGGTTTVNISANGGTAPYTGTGIFTLTAGTYTYNVTDANGCSSTIVISVTEPTSLVANVSAGTISGFGGSTTVTVTANGGTAPYTGTGIFTVTAGTYTYVVTDVNGCSSTVTVTVAEPGQLTASATSGTILCNGGTTTVVVTANGGVAPYTGTGIFTASAGTHTYLVTDANGNTAIATVNISQPNTLVASATSGNILCNGGTTTVNISANGGTAPYTGTGTFTVSAGTYTYVVVDGNGCSSTVTITITQPTALSANASAGTISGFGGSTTVTVTANGGTAPYSGTGIFTVTAGTYTYNVTDVNGCSSTVIVTVAEPGQLTASATSGTILCNGGTTTVVVTANGGVAPYTGTGIFTASAGTNTYLVTDANGNTTIASVNISQPNALVASATSGNILCNGGTTTVNVSVTGGTAPYTGTGIFTVTAGTYTYNVTDANGCSSTVTITITQPTALSANVSTGTISGFGGSTTVTVTANGGTAPYSGTGIFTVTAGTYTYVVTDANGCSSTVTITIGQPGQLTASATAGAILCNGGTTTVVVTANGGVAPYTGTGTFTASTGTNTYLVTDANGNTAVATINISQPNALVALASSGNILCNGGTTTVNISATGGTAPYTGTGIFTVTAGTYTYNVTDANGCSSTIVISVTEPASLVANISAGTISGFGGSTTVTVTANGGTAPYSGTGIFTVTAGTYTYVVTDANGCTKTVTITIGQPASLIASATAGNILCNGGTTTVVVTANGGIAPYTGTGIFTASAGTHTYLVTDANGNTAVATVNISQPNALVASATSGNILCNGGTTTVNVSATGGRVPYTGTGIFTVTAGTYTYVVVDGNGCSSTVAITITQPTALSANVSAGTISGFGGSTTVTVTANGGTAPYSGTGIFTVTAGTYTYVVTDANGCTKTVTITIGQPASLVASATAGNILCNGGTTTVVVTANGGVAPYTGTGIFTASAGTHTYLVTDANGNSAVATVNISQPNALVASATAGNILCNGGTTTVNVSATGGTAPYTGTGIFTVTAGTYTYNVTDANGCSSITTVTISQPSSLLTSVNAGNILCNGGTTTVNVSANGGTAPYSGTGVFVVTAGTHNYLITDANGCSKTVSISVTEPAALSVNVTAGTIPGFGGSTTLTVSANGGTTPYSGVGIFTVTSGSYTYIISDANGCSKTVTITLTQPAALIASANAGNVLCNGGATTVTISANGGVAPYTGTGIFTASAGTHTYLVSDANGNTTLASVNISQPSQLIASASAGNIVCNGGNTTVTVSATGGNAPYSGTGVFTVLAGTYSYIITDANGCNSTTGVTVSQPASLLASASAGNILCAGGTTTVSVSATGGNAPYTGTGIFTVNPGNHTYVVTDANGCSSTANVFINAPSPFFASASVSGNIQCNGEQVNVDVNAIGGTAPYNGTGTFNLGAGTHTFVISDNNGCTASTVVSITQPAALTAVTFTAPIVCNGGVASITVNPVGGTGPYTGDIGVLSLPAGIHTYFINDANGCSTSGVITLVEPSPLVSNLNAGNILCSGESTTISVSAFGGVAPYSGTGIFTVIAGYSSYLITDANGCTTTTDVTLSEPSMLISSSSVITDILCNGGSALLDISAIGGTSPYSGVGSINAVAGSHTYVVTDANGCQSETFITLTEPSPVVVSAIAGACEGSVVPITVTGSGGTAPYTGEDTYYVAPGNYTFQITDLNGCIGEAAILADTAGCWAWIGFSNRVANNTPNVYPNPNNGDFNVDFNGYTGTAYIMNQTGQIVREFTIEEQTEVHVDNLAGGVYYLVTSSSKTKLVIVGR